VFLQESGKYLEVESRDDNGIKLVPVWRSKASVTKKQAEEETLSWNQVEDMAEYIPLVDYAGPLNLGPSNFSKWCTVGVGSISVNGVSQNSIRVGSGSVLSKGKSTVNFLYLLLEFL
jgi:hypothetical protein